MTMPQAHSRGAGPCGATMVEFLVRSEGGLRHCPSLYIYMIIQYMMATLYAYGLVPYITSVIYGQSYSVYMAISYRIYGHIQSIYMSHVYSDIWPYIQDNVHIATAMLILRNASIG